MQLKTKQQINAEVRAEYDQVAGKVVLLDRVECYDAWNNSRTIECDPPAIARILPYKYKSDIDHEVERWMDNEHCDPVYSVEILEKHPAFQGVRVSWVHGTSRSKTGKVDPADFNLAPDEIQQKYKTVPGLPYEIGAAALFPVIAEHGYLRLEQGPRGSLVIALNEFGLKNKAEIIEDHAEHGEMRVFHELWDPVQANSAFETLLPEEIGALTSNPFIIGQGFVRDDQGRLKNEQPADVRVWHFEPYAVQDLVAKLLEDGSVELLAAPGSSEPDAGPRP